MDRGCSGFTKIPEDWKYPKNFDKFMAQEIHAEAFTNGG